MTAADIARRAGVTRATVSNWRRRHPDFPQPVGGTPASPAYDLAAVEAWLNARGYAMSASEGTALAAELRRNPEGGGMASSLMMFALAHQRAAETDRRHLTTSSDSGLAKIATQWVHGLVPDVPTAAKTTFHPGDARLLRMVAEHENVKGANATIDVLAVRLREGSGRRGTGSVSTELSALMAELVRGASAVYPRTVLDPACGTGELLLAAHGHGANSLIGQDPITASAVEAAVRIGLSTPRPQSEIEVRDSLREPGRLDQVTDSDHLVDAVLSLPPFNQRDWSDGLAQDPRWEFGLPAANESEFAWIQHGLSLLKEGGTAVYLLPPGIASSASGRRIRMRLLQVGALRAIISLPAGVAAPVHIGLHLWIVTRPSPRQPAPRDMLFVDAASPRQQPANSPPPAWEEVRDLVLEAWARYSANESDFAQTPSDGARTVPLVELLDDAVDLTPARHVRSAQRTTSLETSTAAATNVRTLLRRALLAFETLASDGAVQWPIPENDRRNWRTASLGDLLRGGALNLMNTPTADLDNREEPVPSTATGRMLTVRDVLGHAAASRVVAMEDCTEAARIRRGDVIFPETVTPDGAVRVADAQDEGTILGPRLLLVRPDPDRLDPWFLAGFLSAPENVHRASSGTTVIRVDARRLQVPLMPLAEQQLYGRSFQRLAALRRTAELAARLAAVATTEFTAGLTDGSLAPPEGLPRATAT